jgi:hypothetical protein
MIHEVNSIEKFFIEKVNSVPCQEDTRAYIVSIFVGFYASDHKDFSKDSLTLEYAKAQSEYNFELFQQIADWILFVKTMYPKSLVVSNEYYDTLARLSYYKCYRILDRQWKLFEELADRFPIVVKHLRAEMKFEPSFRITAF